MSEDSAVPAAPFDLAAAANCLRLIGHPSRLAIVLRVLQGPCLVSEMESQLGLHQPNLSQHLSILRDAGILSSQRQAKTVAYELKAGLSVAIIAAIAAALPGAAGSAPVMPAISGTAAVGPARFAASATDARVRFTNGDDGSVFAHVLPAVRG